VKTSAQKSGVEVDVLQDPTFCEVYAECDCEDRMLICDCCNFGYHMECVDPPLDSVFGAMVLPRVHLVYLWLQNTRGHGSSSQSVDSYASSCPTFQESQSRNDRGQPEQMMATINASQEKA
jgi:hypothetical protein